MTSTILIVEDDVSLQEALKDTLELVGYKTFIAENGAVALQLLAAEKIDLIVSDVEMQEVSIVLLLTETDGIT